MESFELIVLRGENQGDFIQIKPDSKKQVIRILWESEAPPLS